MQQVATRSDLPDGKPVKVEFDGTGIVLVRSGDTVHGFAAHCPHAGAPMEKAAVCDGKLICPWHKAMFDLDTGAVLQPPALEPIGRFEVRVDGEAVLVSPTPVAPPSPRSVSQTDSRVMAIVGGGAAGAAAVAAFGEFGFTGKIVLVGAEPGLPYDRTALSKAVIGGQKTPDQVPALIPEKTWESEQIEFIHDRVERLDADKKLLHLAGGRVVRFDAVLLAPGGKAKRLDVPGAERDGVFVLRTKDDAQAILAAVQAKPKAVIIGGGFIGLEAASGLRAQGLDVEVVIEAELPLEGILGEQIARRLKRLHEENGVVFTVGTVESIAGNDQSAPANAVVLEDGTRIPAGLVLAGVGVTPATDFAGELSLGEDGSLATDRSMHVRGGIFAAGDIARYPFGPAGLPVRIEHWRVAQQQARVAVASMLGRDAEIDTAPLFWTMQHKKRIEVQGHPASFDRIEIDGDLEEMRFIARQYRGDLLVGLVGCGRDTDMAALTPGFPARP